MTMVVTVIRKSYGNIYLAAFIKKCKTLLPCIVVRQMQMQTLHSYRTQSIYAHR